MKKLVVLILAAVLVLTAASASAKGITIAVPNDATNEGRALLLLEAYGVIDVDDEAGITATVADIKDNPLGIEFVEVEAAMVPNVLADVDYGIINGNYALAAELDSALLYENAESPYVNVVSVKEANKDTDEAKALAAAVLLNTAISAGITGALLRKQTKEMPAMSGKGHMRNEMHFDNDHRGKGKTTAPETGQNTEQAQQQSSKASIGVIIKEDLGVIVAQITGENAKKAGFKEGDKIVSVEGKNISASSDLISEVQSHKSGDTITVTVERDGQNIEIKTVLD